MTYNNLVIFYVLSENLTFSLLDHNSKVKKNFEKSSTKLPACANGLSLELRTVYEKIRAILLREKLITEEKHTYSLLRSESK